MTPCFWSRQTGMCVLQQSELTLLDCCPQRQQKAVNRKVLIFLETPHKTGAGNGPAKGKQGFKAMNKAVLRGRWKYSSCGSPQLLEKKKSSCTIGSDYQKFLGKWQTQVHLLDNLAAFGYVLLQQTLWAMTATRPFPESQPKLPLYKTSFI